jgi:hypothetical protein
MRKLNPFKPTDIGGCQLWLDAADRSTFTLSGLNILQWNDKSGLGRNATTVGTIPLSSSINGISTPRYSLNTNTYFSGTSINTGSTLSAFAVYVQNNNSTANNRIVSLGTIGALDWNNISSISAILMLGTNFVSYRNSSQLGSIAATFGVPSLSSSISTGQFNTFYLNGRAGTTVASSGNFNYSTYFIGSTVGEQNFTALSGTIGEVILYNTALTDPQREKVEGYLAQKWGLQPNLPAGSPGRTQVIYPRSPLIDGLTTGQPTRLPFLRSLRISIITPGSLFHLDAGNPASYPGSGSTWTDLAGSGLTTTLFNTPTYSSANGGYLAFAPASSQYGQTSASFATQSVWSVEVWHYYTNTNNGPFSCILTEVWNNTPINFTLGCVSGSTSSLQAAYFNSIWYATTGSYSLPSVGWYHIVGTYDGTNIKLYVNNVLTQTQASTVTPARSNLGIRFMRRWDTGDYWGGRLAIIRIYNRALLASEVTTNYEASKGRFGLL